MNNNNNNNNNNKNMEKSSRPVRNRRHNRRVWPPGGDTHRQVKRLFTPEIKRMLKDWLVRRRDNPYPSRDEKKSLAYETGLTYTQICNWFANWRRKLKNSGKEPTKKTWGHLIKNYNVNAKGNVEQFSICSNDSIWGDDDRSSSSIIINDDNSRSSIYINQKNDCNYNNCNKNNNNNNIQRKIDYNINFDMINCNENRNYEFTKSIQLNDNSKIYKNHILNNNSNNNYYCNNQNESVIDHYYTRKTISNHHHHHHHQPQCFQISSTTMIDDQQNLTLNKTKIMNLNNDDNNNSSLPPTSIQSQLYKTQNFVPVFTTTNTKYKQQMMEKYLRDYNNSKIISKYSSTSSPSSSSSTSSSNSPELSKWLESAANFTPNKSNYFIEWNSSNNNNTTNKNLNKSDKKQLLKSTSITDLPNYVNFYSNSAHQKEELDAAEALANLACNYRQKIISSENYLSSY